MDPLLASLQIVHILFGAFWVSSVFHHILILTPAAKALGPPIQGPVMVAASRC